MLGLVPDRVLKQALVPPPSPAGLWQTCHERSRPPLARRGRAAQHLVFRAGAARRAGRCRESAMELRRNAGPQRPQPLRLATRAGGAASAGASSDPPAPTLITCEAFLIVWQPRYKPF